jgi:hypothetical protein
MHLYLIPEGQSAVEGQNGCEAVRKVELFPAFPNPFNGVVTLRYSLPSDAHVRYSVYDLNGRSVVTSASTFRWIGEHQIRLDASQWPTGVYFFVLNTGEREYCEKILLVK